MYPVGVLFGVGFDTASEVALLFLAAGAAGSGVALLRILCLPILFAAGMSLLDALDGAFMSLAYSWALSRPVRKALSNLVITGRRSPSRSSSAPSRWAGWWRRRS